MECGSSKIVQADDKKRSSKDEVVASFQHKVDMGDDINNSGYKEGIPGNRVNFEGDKSISEDSALVDVDSLGDVNMEASISPDDVTRAGGFGARDDINTLLPVAIDMTDFEATLRDARGYEDQPETIRRPGLGFHETK